RRRAVPKGSTSPADSNDEGLHPAERDANRVGKHGEPIVRAVAEPSLDELQSNAHVNESCGVKDSDPCLQVKQTKPEYQRAVGKKMTQLVAVLEVELR